MVKLVARIRLILFAAERIWGEESGSGFTLEVRWGPIPERDESGSTASVPFLSAIWTP
jgi:hypothetical protein